jgi:hypothetical protein
LSLIYHGYAIKGFSILRIEEQNALIKAGLVNRKGKFVSTPSPPTSDEGRRLVDAIATAGTDREISLALVSGRAYCWYSLSAKRKSHEKLSTSR